MVRGEMGGSAWREQPLKKGGSFQTQNLFNNHIIAMENTGFRILMRQVEAQEGFGEWLSRIEQEFLVKLYKITDLKAETVSDLYQNMQKKFYLHRKADNEEFWYENELRIFIWLLFAYLYVHQKSITALSHLDWQFFSEVFNFKSTVFFEFQARSIIKSRNRPASWTPEETAILQDIMQEARLKNRWNSIARELFVRSGKQFFRNPKQCRERWMNHLDPTKLHSEWTPAEDIVLLNTIRKRGKRWSLAVRELSHTRTEHMVKNRYKSLISNEAKKYPEKREAEIEAILLKRLTKAHERTLKAGQTKLEEEEEEEEGQMHEPKGEKTELKKECPEARREREEVEVKVENEECMQVENFQFLDEISLKSPIFIPWKTEDRQPIDLMGDQKMGMESPYDYSESDHSAFLRF